MWRLGVGPTLWLHRILLEGTLYVLTGGHRQLMRLSPSHRREGRVRLDQRRVHEDGVASDQSGFLTQLDRAVEERLEDGERETNTCLRQHAVVRDRLIEVVAEQPATRVEQQAADGELGTSSTVRDLMLGGSASFRERGEHQLKGNRRQLVALRRQFGVAAELFIQTPMQPLCRPGGYGSARRPPSVQP